MKIVISKSKWERLGKTSQVEGTKPGQFGEGLSNEAMNLLKQYGIGPQQLYLYTVNSTNPREKEIAKGIEMAKMGNIDVLKVALEKNKEKKGIFSKEYKAHREAAIQRGIEAANRMKKANQISDEKVKNVIDDVGKTLSGEKGTIWNALFRIHNGEVKELVLKELTPEKQKSVIDWLATEERLDKNPPDYEDENEDNVL